MDGSPKPAPRQPVTARGGALRRATALAGLLAAFWSAAPATAEVFEVGPGEDLRAAVDALRPGDTLVLAGGLYTLTSRFSIELPCTAANPCAIRAKAGETPHLHRPQDDQNIVDVEGSHHLSLIGLELSGGSRGLRIRESTFITVDRCHIHHTADAALTANDPGSRYEGLRLVRNHLHDTGDFGEGMYLGCNYNGCQVFASLIEGNHIHHTDGPTVVQGDGIEIKEGSWGNTVRDNVIHHTGYPCILTYSTVGNGPPNVIERNLLWGCGDNAIQAAADAVIRNNVILGAAGNGIANQPHQSGTPSNLEVTHNTVIAPSGAAYRASGIDGAVVVANNVLYALGGTALRVSGDLAAVVVSGNAGEGSLEGIGGGFTGGGDLATSLVAASYSGELPQNPFPTPTSPLLGAADPVWLAVDDFNGHPRGPAADAGAYKGDPSGNPGWPLAAGFKPTAGLFADGFESGDTSAWGTPVP